MGQVKLLVSHFILIQCYSEKKYQVKQMVIMPIATAHMRTGYGTARPAIVSRLDRDRKSLQSL